MSVSEGKYLETIYVIKMATDRSWFMGPKKVRPDSLTCRGYSRGIKYDRTYLPTKE